MNTTRVYLWLLIFLSLIIVLQGCQKPAPITIGFSAGLSGANSEVGIGLRNAVELMVDQVNQAGGINGRQLELLIKDDENSLEKVAVVDQAFIDEGVMVIIGHDMSFKVVPSLKTIKDKPVIMISPTISDYKVSGLDDNFLRTSATNYDQGAILATFAKENDKVTRVLAVMDMSNQTFYDGFVKGFKDVSETEIEHVAIEKGITDDVERIIAAFHSGDYQGILMVLNSMDTAYLVQRLTEEKIVTRFYSSNWAMTPDVIEQGGHAIDGVRFIAMIDLFSQNTGLLDFKKEYYDRYKKEPNFSAIYGYETSQMVIAALQKTKKMSYSALKTEILALSPFESIQGTIIMDAYGDIKRDAHIYTVEKGQYKKLK
jgi:branched-chain amino acid transport system substrate-binding protein